MSHQILRPRGTFDLGPALNRDGTAKIYIIIIVLWTIILFAGVIALVLLRNLTCIRIRSVTLSVAAVATLHGYLIPVMMVYFLNGVYPCNLEWWIMSIYLPFGVALFQAQNVLLLQLSGLQRRLMQGQSPPARTVKLVRAGLAGWRDRWCRSNLVQRTFLGIGLGLVIQVVLSFFIFFMSRKFHPYGVFSTYGDTVRCRRGPEWFPSAFWQALWAYGYGPYILYKIRNIRDVHRWKIQTSLAIVFGLPGLPLVIAAIYAPAFRSISRSVPPPVWYAPGIIMMEFVTVFFPLMEAYQSRYRQRLRISALDQWEQGRDARARSSSDSLQRTSSLSHTEKQDRRDMYGMNALERALSDDPSPLLNFAAEREFTGENIIFLTKVREWKRAWDQAHARGPPGGSKPRRMMFEQGAELFFRTVCLSTAAFPVNVEGKIYVTLEKIFRPDLTSSPTKSVVTPFDDDIYHHGKDGYLTDKHIGVVCSEEEVPPSPSPSDDIAIPAEFDRAVFDAAEASVKYMVLTNTWARYMDSSEATSLRSRSQGSTNTDSSGRSSFFSLMKRRG